MTRVIVDDVLRTKLHNLSQPLELCDESGRVLGRVFPALDLSQYEPWEPAISEEELQQQEQANEKRYNTAEVLAQLEQPRPSIAELLADHALITEAISRAVREAVLEHARAGRPIATWEDGKVVWIPPAEILARLEDKPPQ